MHLGLGRGRVSSPAADSLTRCEPRWLAPALKSPRDYRESLATRGAAYEDTLPLRNRSQLHPFTSRALQLVGGRCSRTGNDRRRVGPRTIAERFGDVSGRDFGDIIQISDCTRNLQDAMIAARGEAQALGCGLKERSRFGIYRRVRVQPTTDRESVAGYSWLFRESFSLRRASMLNSCANRG